MTKSPGAVVSTHACNVQYVSDKLLVEQYGLTVGKDILVTASTLPVSAGAYIKYNDIVYRVVEAPAHDTHVKLIAKRWQP